MRRLSKWLRFSLRSMLIAFTIAAVWLGMTISRARRQERAVSRLERCGGYVAYDRPKSAEPHAWERWRGMISKHHFESPIQVTLDVPRRCSDWLAAINALPTVRTLLLSGGSVTDQTLADLRLTQIDALHLTASRVTDRGLAQLARFKRLRWLGLSESQITGDGCALLEPLSELEELDLYGTKITDDAVPHLKKLTRLRRLMIPRTGITDRGLEELHDALPGCVIIR